MVGHHSMPIGVTPTHFVRSGPRVTPTAADERLSPHSPAGLAAPSSSSQDRDTDDDDQRDDDERLAEHTNDTVHYAAGDDFAEVRFHGISTAS
jgi:hypothetical protein